MSVIAHGGHLFYCTSFAENPENIKTAPYGAVLR